MMQHEPCHTCGKVSCNIGGDDCSSRRITALERENKELKATIKAWSKPVAVIKGSIVNGYVIHQRHVGGRVPDGPATVRVFTDPAAALAPAQDETCGEPAPKTCAECGSDITAPVVVTVNDVEVGSFCSMMCATPTYNGKVRCDPCRKCKGKGTIPTGIRGIEYRTCPVCNGEKDNIFCNNCNDGEIKFDGPCEFCGIVYTDEKGGE